jgi:TusA-related sulfurtransferase
MAEIYLDCLGEACPVPLIKTQAAMEKMNINDVLSLISTTAVR